MLINIITRLHLSKAHTSAGRTSPTDSLLQGVVILDYRRERDSEETGGILISVLEMLTARESLRFL